MMQTLRKAFYAIFFLALAMAFITFAYQNDTSIGLKFLHWESSKIPLFLFLILSIALGVFLASMVFFVEVIRLKSQTRREAKRANALEKEVSLLRTDPISSGYGQESRGKVLSTQKPDETEIEKDPSPSIHEFGS